MDIGLQVNKLILVGFN